MMMVFFNIKMVFLFITYELLIQIQIQIHFTFYILHFTTLFKKKKKINKICLYYQK